MFVSIQAIKSFLIEFTDYSKNINIKKEKTDLHKLLDTCLSAGITHNIRVIKSYDDNLPTVLLDKGKISASFAELLSNSADFLCPQNGWIRICTTLASQEEKEDNNLDADEYVKINFIDNGPGVSIKEKGNIFNPLCSIRPETPSEEKVFSGLGLAIVKKYITNHKGLIREIGEYGKGADFEIFLPVNFSV